MQSEKLKIKHLISIKDLTPEEIDFIFQTSTQFKEVINRPIKKVPTLRDYTIANIFFENSTRTKLSFELAQKRLSADVINFSSSSSSVTKGETLIDTVNNILAMKVDMVVMRHPSAGAAKFLSENTKATIINAGDGTNEHPTQALLDAFSLKEKFGTLKDLNVLITGDILHSRVALSNIYCLKKLGANVTLCGPPSLIPKYIEELGVKVNYNFAEALKWCDAVNMLRIQMERQNDKYFPSIREYTMLYSLNKELYDSLNKKIIIMHPGPINRGVELPSEMADFKDSIILDQVENGVAVRMAMIYLLSKN